MPITAVLAAALATAAFAGPAAAVSADTHSQSTASHAVTLQDSHAERAAATALAGPPTWAVNPQPITRSRAVAATPPGPPTWPTSPQPIDAPDSGLDWLSVGIGAAAAGLFAIALVGIAGLRRRITRPQSLTTTS